MEINISSLKPSRFFPDPAQLFPSLDALHKWLEDKSGQDHQRRWDLEALPYALRATYWALLDLVATQHALVTSSLLKPGVVVLVGDEGRDRLGFAVDLFFDAARRSQNAVCTYISKVLSRSLPQSLSVACDRCASKSPTSVFGDQELGSFVLDYWNSGGRRLRDYRNRIQHSGNVLSDGRMFLAPDAKPRFYLALPDNPQDAAVRRFTYLEPVHARPYLQREFVQLACFVRRVTDRLAALKGVPPHRSVANVNFRDPMKLAEEARRGNSVLSPADLHEVVQNDVVRFAQKDAPSRGTS